MTAGVGHNSIDCGELKTLVDRVENLITQRTEVNDDIKDVYAEAKARGYDAKTMRAIIQIRKMGTPRFQEQRTLLDTYLAAFGIEI